MDRAFKVIFFVGFLFTAWAFKNSIYVVFLPYFGSFASLCSWALFSGLLAFYAKGQLNEMKKLWVKQEGGSDGLSLLTKFVGVVWEYYVKGNEGNGNTNSEMEKEAKLNRKANRWLNKLIEMAPLNPLNKPIREIYTNWPNSLDWSDNADRGFYDRVKNIRSNVLTRLSKRDNNVRKIKENLLNIMGEGDLKAAVDKVTGNIELDQSQLNHLLPSCDDEVKNKILKELTEFRFRNDIKAASSEGWRSVSEFFGVLNALLNGFTNAALMCFGHSGGMTVQVAIAFITGFINSNQITKPKAMKTFLFWDDAYVNQLSVEQWVSLVCGVVMALGSCFLNLSLWWPMAQQFMPLLLAKAIVFIGLLISTIFAGGLYAHGPVKNSRELTLIWGRVVDCYTFINNKSLYGLVQGLYEKLKGASWSDFYNSLERNVVEIGSMTLGGLMSFYYIIMMRNVTSAFQGVFSFVVFVPLLTVWRALFKSAGDLFNEGSLEDFTMIGPPPPPPPSTPQHLRTRQHASPVKPAKTPCGQGGLNSDNQDNGRRSPGSTGGTAVLDESNSFYRSEQKNGSPQGFKAEGGVVFFLKDISGHTTDVSGHTTDVEAFSDDGNYLYGSE